MDVAPKVKKPTVHWKPQCRVLKRWLDKHAGTFFNKASLKADLRLSEKEWSKTYQCLTYWRDKFRDYMAYRYDRGKMNGPDHAALLEVAYRDFYAEWGMQPFYNDGVEYYVPDLRDKIVIDNRRLIRKAYGIETVARESLHSNVTLRDGTPMTAIIGDIEQIKQKLLDGMDSKRG